MPFGADEVDDAHAHGSAACPIRAKRKRKCTGAGLFDHGRRRPHNLWKPQERDVGAIVAAGGLRRHGRTVWHNNLIFVGLRQRLFRGDQEIAAPKRAGQMPSVGCADRCQRRLRGGSTIGGSAREFAEKVGAIAHIFSPIIGREEISTLQDTDDIGHVASEDPAKWLGRSGARGFRQEPQGSKTLGPCQCNCVSEI